MRMRLFTLNLCIIGVIVSLLIGCTPKIKRSYTLPTNRLTTIELFDSTVWINTEFATVATSTSDSLVSFHIKNRDSINLIVQPESKYSHMVHLINSCKSLGTKNIELFSAGEHALSLNLVADVPDSICNVVTFINDSSWSVGVTKSPDLSTDSFYILPPIPLIETKDDSGFTSIYVKDTLKNQPATGAYFKRRGEFFCKKHGVDIVKMDELHVDSMYKGIQIRMMDKECDYYYIHQRGSDLLRWAEEDDTILVSRPVLAKYQLLQNHFYAISLMREFKGKKHVTFSGAGNLSFSAFEPLYQVATAMKINAITFTIADKAKSGVDVAILKEKFIADNQRLKAEEEKENLEKAKKRGYGYTKGVRSKADIMRTVRRNLSKLNLIYKMSIKKNMVLPGKINLWFYITNTGEVINAEIHPNETALIDTTFTKQVVTEAKAWDFGQIEENDTTIISFPFVFNK